MVDTLILFMVILFVIPSRLVVPGLGAAGRPAGLFATGILFSWFASLFVASRRPAPVSVMLRWAVYVYAMVLMAAYVAGLDRGLPGVEALSMDRKVLVVSGFAGIVLAATDGLRTRDSVRRTLWVLVSLGAANSVVGVIQFAFNVDPSGSVTIPGLVSNRATSEIGTRGLAQFTRVRGTTNHPIEFGVLLASLFPIAVQLAMSNARSTRSQLRWLPAILIGIGIPLSISRSATLGLIVGLIVLATGWTWRERANACAAAVAVVLAFQAIVPGLLGTIKGLFLRLETDSSISARTDDFSATADFIRQRPWLGRGPGTFLSDRYRTLDNEYLGTILETGFLGLASLAILFLVAGLTARSVVRWAPGAESRETARALGASLSVGIVSFATFDALSFPIYAGAFFVVMGCIGALYRIERTELSS